MRPKYSFTRSLLALELLVLLLIGLATHGQPASPKFVPRNFPVVATTIYGTTSIGAYTNISLGGAAYTTTNADGTTGLPITQGFGMGVEVIINFTNGTSMTNGNFTAYFAPSVGGTNVSTTTNEWWLLSGVATGVGSTSDTNSRRYFTNFSPAMLGGFTHLHCVGFWNANSNYVTSVSVRGGVPKF